MGGSAGKGRKEQTQTVNQVNMPPSWAKPLFEKGAAEAKRLYDGGLGGNVYQGQRVADLSGATRAGIDALQAAAGKFGDAGLQGLARGGTSSQANLQGLASGSMIGNNPHFNAALQRGLDSAATTINSQMAGAGRYGSGAHSGVLANNLGGIATSAMSDQYNRDIANMMTANGQIDAANQAQLGAAGNWFGQGVNANRAALEAAGLLDAHNQNKLNADWQKWSEEDNKDWSRLGLLESAANGFAGSYGNQNATTVAQGAKNNSSLMNTLGGAGQFLGGLMGKSDERAKKNTRLVGRREVRNGTGAVLGYLGLYEFEYKDGVVGARAGRWRGVMAGEVARLMPDAVRVDERDGLAVVDYGLLGMSMERVA